MDLFIFTICTSPIVYKYALFAPKVLHNLCCFALLPSQISGPCCDSAIFPWESHVRQQSYVVCEDFYQPVLSSKEPKTSLFSIKYILKIIYGCQDKVKPVQISGGSRPSDKGWGGGVCVGGGGWCCGHPDPEISGGPVSQKCFQPFGPQFGLKIRGGGAGPPGALP